MCEGRYAAKVMRNERSEMEHNRSEMPAISHNKYASQRDAISPPMDNLMLSHSAGMHNTYISIAGISKRFHFASLHYIFSAYLPTHIKSLWDFLQSSLNIWLQGRPVVQFQKRKPISAGRDRLYLYRLFLCECKNYLMPSSAFTFADTSSIELPL